jgi:hypothetical protein
MVGLGDLSGGTFYSIALGVSGDGSVVVGKGADASGRGAFIWSAATGMKSLRDVLINEHGLGAALAGWTLDEATGISSDGLVIAGYGCNPQGLTEAWVVNLRPPVPEPVPEPASAALAALGAGALAAARRRGAGRG